MEQSQNDHGDDVQASTAFGDNQAGVGALIGAAQTNLQILMKKMEEIKELEKALLREESQSDSLTDVVPHLQFLASTLNGEYDFAANRATLDVVYKHINYITAKATRVQDELTEQVKLLRQQSEAQRAFCNVSTTTPHDMAIKEHEAEAMASSEELTGKMGETICKLQSNMDQLAKHLDQCKLSSE